LQDLKYTLQVAPKSIARLKGLEVAYKSVIDDFIHTQEEVSKAREEQEQEQGEGK
jgi:hypothetical protein